MSNKALGFIFEHSNTKGSARVLMLAIADMANDEGECYPGRAYLAAKVNVSERQLTTLIRDCEELGELRVFQRSQSDEDNRTNKYYIVGLYDASRVNNLRDPQPRPRRKVDENAEHRFRYLHENTRTPLPVVDENTRTPLPVVDENTRTPLPVVSGGHRKTASGGRGKTASGGRGKTASGGRGKTASTNPLHITQHTTQTKEPKIAAAKTAAAAPRSAPPSIIQSPSEPATSIPSPSKPKKQKSEQPAAAPDDPKKQRDAALAELIAAWKDTTGDLNPNVYANKTIRAGAGAMVDAGITVQDVTAYLDDLTTDDWWSSRAVPFSHVVSNIQAWKREAEVYANYEVPKPDLPETDLTWEELRAMGEELKKTLAERNSLRAVIARADAEYQSPFDRLRDHMAARGEQLP